MTEPEPGTIEWLKEYAQTLERGLEAVALAAQLNPVVVIYPWVPDACARNARNRTIASWTTTGRR